jgi:hypothetical protein
VVGTLSGMKRTFYLDTADYERAPRMAPMVRAVRRALGQRPYKYAELVELALDESDLKRNTVKTWLSGAVGAGMIKQTGKYRAVGPVDTRKLALGDWPECPHHCFCDYH